MVDTPTLPIRRMRVDALIEQFPPQDLTGFGDGDPDPAGTLAAGGRFLLIERSVFGDGHLLTPHDSAADAASYHDASEYDDWSIVVLVDLDTGDGYDGEVSTTFTRRKS